MRNLLLLNDTTDHSNWGSQATGYSLQHILKENLEDIKINSAYSGWIVENYYQRPSLLGSKVVTKLERFLDRRSTKIKFIPTVADEFEVFQEYWNNNKSLRPIKETLDFINANDDIIFNAEGSTYRNNYSSQRSLYTLWYAKNNSNKNTYFLNGMVNITDVDSRMNAYVKRTFSNINGAAIREPYSIRALEKYKITGNIKLAPDAVFYYANNYNAHLNTSDAFKKLKLELKGKKYFCFSLSMLPIDYQFNPDKSSLLKLINEVKKVIPNAVIMAKDPSDQFLADLARRSNSVFFGAEYNHHDLFELLTNASALLSGRYHHVMMASIVGCPSITFTTTSHKMQGLVELLGNKLNFPFDATYIKPDIENIVTQTSELLQNKTIGDELISISKKLGDDAMTMGKMMIQ